MRGPASTVNLKPRNSTSGVVCTEAGHGIILIIALRLKSNRSRRNGNYFSRKFLRIRNSIGQTLSRGLPRVYYGNYPYRSPICGLLGKETVTGALQESTPLDYEKLFGFFSWILERLHRPMMTLIRRHVFWFVKLG